MQRRPLDSFRQPQAARGADFGSPPGPRSRPRMQLLTPAQTHPPRTSATGTPAGAVVHAPQHRDSRIEEQRVDLRVVEPFAQQLPGGDDR